MPGTTIKVSSREAAPSIATSRCPQARAKYRRSCSPPPCMASTRTFAISPTKFASHGVIAAAPDLFWRSLPGPLAAMIRVPPSARSRGWRRSGSARPTWPIPCPFAHAAAVQRPRRRDGFCYGGPYAILGPKRLATTPASPVTAPDCSISSARSMASRRRSASCGATRTTPRLPRCSRLIVVIPQQMPNVEVHIFPGVLHGYMMPGIRRRSVSRRAISP